VQLDRCNEIKVRSTTRYRSSSGVTTPRVTSPSRFHRSRATVKKTYTVLVDGKPIKDGTITLRTERDYVFAEIADVPDGTVKVQVKARPRVRVRHGPQDPVRKVACRRSRDHHHAGSPGAPAPSTGGLATPPRR